MYASMPYCAFDERVDGDVISARKVIRPITNDQVPADVADKKVTDTTTLLHACSPIPPPCYTVCISLSRRCRTHPVETQREKNVLFLIRHTDHRDRTDRDRELGTDRDKDRDRDQMIFSHRGGHRPLWRWRNPPLPG
jgi:hypothetical protein